MQAGTSRMLTRPELWEYKDPETGDYGFYSSYIWDYQITNEFGLVSFNVSFNQDLIADFARVFDESMFSSGSITRESLEDYRLYVRVIHAPVFNAGDMAFVDKSEVYGSNNDNVFDLSRVSELDDYDFSATQFYRGSYGEGLITVHAEDLLLGVPDLLVYQMESGEDDIFAFDIEIAEADLIPNANIMTEEEMANQFDQENLIPELGSSHSYLTDGSPVVVTITDYNGNSPFAEGSPQFIAYVDQNGQVVIDNTTGLTDYYLTQLDPGVYQINIYMPASTSTKEVYRFCTLEVRPENWMKFGQPTMTLDLLNWYDSGWGGASFGNDYGFYEDIYPRLTGYLATLHSQIGLDDYVNFKIFARAREIGSQTAWNDLEWFELGDEDVWISSLVYDGLYYFEYPLGQDGAMLMGKEVQLNVTVDASYNQTGMIEDNREQKLHILNMSIVSSDIRTDMIIYQTYSDSDITSLTIGDVSAPYGVERYFEFTDDIDTYGIESNDVLLSLRGYEVDSIEVVEVRGMINYREEIISSLQYNFDSSGKMTLNEGPIADLDNHSDLIISYAIQIDSGEVLSFTYSEQDGFSDSQLIFNPITCDHDSNLGVFYSTFNESYSLDSNGKATLHKGFDGVIDIITTDDFEFYRLSDLGGYEITDTLENINIINSKQIELDFLDTTSQTVYISYGIATYKLDRGYQRIDMNVYDAVRKLSELHSSNEIYDYGSGQVDVDLIEVPAEPENPMESNSPIIVVPFLRDNKTTVSFEYLSLLYDTTLSGTFYLDDCALENAANLKPILATFTITTEDGESYFDYVDIVPTSGENEIDFEISLQPIYATIGYTTFDVQIDFLSYGDNPNIVPYVIISSFNLTADDRILETVSKPRVDSEGNLQVSTIINTQNYAQIFTDRLTDAYDVVDNAWFTIAVEGFNGYGDLVELYRDENDDLAFETQEDDQFYFQCLEENDRRLVDSLGFHLNAYDLELPEYIEGEVNLYAGKGNNTYGDEYISDLEFTIDWRQDYVVDVNNFDEDTFNENFVLSELPLTSDGIFIEGELYLHHKIDITESQNIITTDLPSGVDFAILIPDSTERIGSIEVSNIDRIARPWDWVESWQGFALTEADYMGYNPVNALSYPTSFVRLTPSYHYEVVLTDEGLTQVHFFDPVSEIVSKLGSDVIQIDFHTVHEFTPSDYAIEDQNTYNSELHWQFPVSEAVEWLNFAYHPDLTNTATFNASFYQISEYAPVEDFKSFVVDEFQFYPYEYNFTEFTFTGFTDYGGELFYGEVDLTHGGEFQGRYGDIEPFGMVVQTSYGERYIDAKYIYGWGHQGSEAFSLTLSRYDFREIDIIEDSEVLLTYYYPKESLSYIASQDDILFGASNSFVVKDELGIEIDLLGNILSIEGNNITFTENMKTELAIGEKFTVEYYAKTRGGLLETKHMFIEVQPWEMQFYNDYYPFSGSSIMSPLYYNLSANYQYQMALNYRLVEKNTLTLDFTLDGHNIYNDVAELYIDYNQPLLDYDSTPIIFAYFYNLTGDKSYFEEPDMTYDSGIGKLSIALKDGYGVPNYYFDSITQTGPIGEGNVVFVEIGADFHNKYQYFHNLEVDLTNEDYTLLNWEVAQDPENNLAPNFESNYFVFDYDSESPVEKGMVQEIMAILNETNTLTYYLSEELSDPNGWDSFDTLIMRLRIMNPEVLSSLKAEFYYNTTMIGETEITLDMIESETGSVYITLPEASNWDQFTTDNNARIIFTPEFLTDTDFYAYYYEEGYPYLQTVQWVDDDSTDGFLPVDLERNMFSTSEPVFVLNGEFEYIYPIWEIGNRTDSFDYNGVQNAYDITVNNISLPDTYLDGLENAIEMSDNDILFLKYNSTLPKTISLAVGEMILQRAPYIENFRKGEPGEPDYVPFAEVSLLGINNEGEEYSVELDLFENRDKMVAWESQLDLTPFENEFLDTYRQKVFNVSFEDISSAFKVIDSEGIDHCYITDIVISSNDPRYQIIIDSFFMFEFDENATLYDSDIFEVYPNNQLEKFYYGDYEDIYSEHIIFDSGSDLPLYYDDNGVNETFYFDAFDTAGNYYYFDDHLFGETVSQGIYDVYWNNMYSEHYNAWYYDEQTTEEELEGLREDYNPHIEKFRYLYLSWADVDAWEEWQLIDQPNVNTSSLGITFKWYDEATEDYSSVLYNRSLSEFETRHIAIENVYPYDTDTISGEFDLSQDYTPAQDLAIYSITGFYFNESEYEFNLLNCYIVSGEESIYIEAETGIILSDFDRVVVLLSFTSGVLSDYSQFKLLNNAFNHPDAPAWTKNDSIYVDFEYTDLDYFLLMEDYEVGSDDSLFEHLEYTRNVNFVQNEQDIFALDVNYQSIDFENFEAKNDLKNVLLMTDFDEDGTHESVLEKLDITGDGEFNVFKYGSVDPAGEISYHTIVYEADPVQTQVDKDFESMSTEWFDLEQAEQGDAKRTMLVTTITNIIQEKNYYSVQKDTDLDGFMDEETSYEVIYNNVNITTYTKEITEVKASIGSFGFIPEDQETTSSEELRVSSFVSSKMSQTMIFSDLESGEVVSTRVYEDAFPNELSEANNIENYLVPAISELITSQTTDLSVVFGENHARDGVPIEFDQLTTIEDGEIATENLLTTTQSISIPGTYSYNGQGFDAYTVEAIKSKPAEGTYWLNNLKSSSLSNRDQDGYYLYLDTSNDSVYETVIVMDKNDNVVGIGFDYDLDSKFHPGKTLPVEKDIIWSENYAGDSIYDDYIHFRESDKEMGVFNEPTFSDVLFDVSKMDFTGESSDLIEIAEEMATNQFEEQTDLGTLVLDVFQQFLATTAGLVSAAFLDKGAFGFMLGYLGVSILFQTAKILEQENYFAHRTFRLDGSSGEKVLGDKFWFDDMYGDIMPITIFGSFGGVYAPVRGDTKEFSYSADVIVREFNFEESKASSLTTSYSYPKLDYWLSTRNLAGYSDFDDDLVVGYLQSTGAINQFVDNIGIPEFNHAKSSVYYIENQIQEDTADNRDTYLDTIIPTIDYDSERDRFAPRYSFVDSMGGIPAPEFYTEYPVIVSDDSSAVDQYGSIYKVMEIENPEEITSIEIQLFDSESDLQADIVSIDAYVVWRVTPNSFGAGTDTCNSHIVSLRNGEFKVNLTSGIITIGSDPALSTILNKYATKEEELDEDKFSYSVSQPKILFQIKVEKYRSISDVRDLTSEQISKIATAQAIEASILEYNYQFNLATQTQMGFHELIYTAIVTAISTALTMGFSAGMGSIVNSLKDSAKKVSSKMLGRLMGSVLGAAESFTVATVIGAVVKEMGQEILLDPWIESTVSGLVRRAGGNAILQMVLSSIAESGREAISGPLTSLFRSVSSQIQSLSERLDSKYTSKGLKPTMQQFLTEISEYKTETTSQQEQNAEQMASLRGANKVLSFVSLATGFAASFLLGPVGVLAYATLTTYCLTEGISLKGLFKKSFNPETTTSDQPDQKVSTDDLVATLGKELYLFTQLLSPATVPSMRSNIHLYDNYNPPVEPSSSRTFDMFIDVLKSSLAREGLVDTMEFEGNPNYVRHKALEEFIDLTKLQIRQYGSNLARNVDIPPITNIASLYLSLLAYVKPEINLNNWRVIDIAFQDFYNAYRIQAGFSNDFESFKKLYLNPATLDFSEFKVLSGVPTTKTPNRDLLISWISKEFLSEFPQYKSTLRGFTKTILSKIFYKKNSRAGLFKSDYDYINLYKLFELLYYNEEISVSRLRSIGIKEANDFNVERLKENTKQIIKKFIFSNVYSRKYIYSNLKYLTRDPEYFIPEFDLCLDLYLAFSRENGKPLNLKEFAKELEGYPGFTFHANVGPAKWDTIVKLMGEFRGNHYALGILMKKLSGENYKLASAAIRRYLNEREISVPNPTYHIDWSEPEIVDSHLIFLILRDLGIEIQSLKEVPTRSFRKSLADFYKFVRHHIFKNDKKSIDINRLVLTLKGLHPSLENLDSNTILQLINDMLDWNNKKCPDFYKIALPNNKWIDRWQEVLDRREFIKKEGVGKFLLTYYDELIIRVFGYRVKNPQVVENRIKQLYTTWINNGNKWPVLPIEILKALGLTSSQTLITNFLGSKP